MKDIKYYFTATLKCTSPLHIGGGLDENSDSDILLDVDDKPFIPGTTLAGKIKQYLKEYITDIDSLFGRAKLHKNDSDLQSEIILYDAEFSGKSPVISIRDNVKISEDGVAEKGVKFDYEILEPGASFNFRAELLTETDEYAREIFSYIIDGFNRGDIRLGAKTSRGLGKILADDSKDRSINLHEKMDDYINFEWAKVTKDFDSIIKDENDNGVKLYETLNVSFTINTFLFVRNYAGTAQDENNDNKLVDAEQLRYKNGEVVIPGTSWAGVFRHHCERILKKANQSADIVKEFFGDADNVSKKKVASKIIFLETVVEASKMHSRTRNAIDRFTGSAGDGLLFTSQPAYGGNGNLEIKIPKSIMSKYKGTEDEENKYKATKARIKNLIDICIQDFNDGFLNIGSEGSVGGGLICMKKEGGWL